MPSSKGNEFPDLRVGGKSGMPRARGLPTAQVFKTLRKNYFLQYVLNQTVI